MLFSSNLFLFLFLPSVIFGYYLLPKRFRNYFLLISSLIFYGWGATWFFSKMIAIILFNYVMALAFTWEKLASFRKPLLFLTIAGNLSVLFVYKYLDFAITNLNYLGFSLRLQHIALPLGISFFTFQAMSYSIDVYRGHAKVQKNPFNIALYVSFFPQLVAGPIVRYQTIADQIDCRHENFNDFSYGVKRFIMGFCKKIILANNISLIAEEVFSSISAESSILYAWIGALGYCFQVYFDFAGYSDMAIGMGKMFGFHFLENFNHPYICKSISDFWRRWHISLGQWFRDYVYFPLGGSRVKSTARLLFNTFVVWTLTGVWHGANWNYVVWGVLFAVLISFEKMSGWPNKFQYTWQKELYRLFTLLCITIGTVIFWAPDLPGAFTFCKNMFGLNGNPFTDDLVIKAVQQYGFYFLACFVFSTPIFGVLKEKLSANRRMGYALDILSIPMYAFLLIWAVSFIIMGSHNPFIYFNF